MLMGSNNCSDLNVCVLVLKLQIENQISKLLSRKIVKVSCLNQLGVFGLEQWLYWIEPATLNIRVGQENWLFSYFWHRKIGSWAPRKTRWPVNFKRKVFRTMVLHVVLYKKIHISPFIDRTSKLYLDFF